MIAIALTDHLEAPPAEGSSQVYAEVAELVELADSLGVGHFFFAEHHAHAHHGHLPSPLLFALHLASRTRQIQLGAAIVCLNLHHPLDVAEQAAVADLLMHQRLAPGFGSGSTPDEFTLFGLQETAEEERHESFARALQVILSSWDSSSPILPKSPTLPQRTFQAVNSLGAARIAGRFNLNMLFSHLRTAEQYRQYREAYRAAGGSRLIAANRPVYVAETDQAALAAAEPALRILWRRFQQEGKIPATMAEPSTIEQLAAHPINFILGSPRTVAEALLSLHAQVPFDIANLEIRWPGLSHAQVQSSLNLLMTQVAPLLTP